MEALCWLKRGVDVVIGPISAEDAARVDQAIDELSDWCLPQVWVGNPDWDEHGNPVGLKADWLKLVEFLGVDLLPRSEQIQLFEEAMHVCAARGQLVTVKKVLPLDGITIAEQASIASLKQPIFATTNGSSPGMVDPFGSRFRLADWRGGDTVMLFQFPPDEYFPLGSTNFYSFVARDVVTNSHLPYLNDFFSTALYGPFETWIEATDEVVFVAKGLEEIERILE
jgi:hypothetical protein